ncbi:MAG TPA: hypothetical protein H9691_09065 [Firmicutes bacterium]|nr:hypothetical protein [Bacillota bacterium]
MTTNLQEFRNIWKKFTVLCRARLLEKSRQGRLTRAGAEMAVMDAACDWLDPYTACGSWLKALEENEPGKAGQIRQLVRKIELEPVPEPKALPVWGVAAAALAVAAVGGAVTALMLHGAWWQTALAAIIPAVVVGGGLCAVRGTQQQAKGKYVLDEYVRQLDLLGQEIEGILQMAG